MYLKEESQRNFNPKVYLELYPEVKKKYTIKTAWQHYKQYGKYENRIFTNIKGRIQLKIKKGSLCID